MDAQLPARLAQAPQLSSLTLQGPFSTACMRELTQQLQPGGALTRQLRQLHLSGLSAQGRGPGGCLLDLWGALGAEGGAAALTALTLPWGGGGYIWRDMHLVEPHLGAW